jgi:hypothetical protein
MRMLHEMRLLFAKRLVFSIIIIWKMLQSGYHIQPRESISIDWTYWTLDSSLNSHEGKGFKRPVVVFSRFNDDGTPGLKFTKGQTRNDFKQSFKIFFKGMMHP